jgi:hypothetical protein
MLERTAQDTYRSELLGELATVRLYIYVVQKLANLGDGVLDEERIFGSGNGHAEKPG